MSLLVVCPTRNRPGRCRKMLDSFFATRSHGTDIALYVDEQDPQIAAYRELAAAEPRAAFEFGPRLTIVEVFNHAFDRTDHAHYADCNDDFVYRTAGWDEKLIEAIERLGNGLGMAHGRLQNLPSGAVFNARSLRALGWWFPPGFRHQFVDDVQVELFCGAGLLFAVPEVFIEHEHPTFGTAAWDAGYAEAYSAEAHAYGRAMYHHYKRERLAADVGKLLRCKQSL